MDEVRLPDWPEPGPNVWLPAYGFHHDIMDKEDYFNANGDTGSTHALYLETIVEETSEDLRSERSCAATWLSDSDADSVLQVKGPQGSECDSESEREWACPAKRRRRERPASPASSASLSRTSSLAQFESLERSCAAPASPSLSPDSLDSPPTSPPRTRRAPPLRQHLSAENLSEDSGYSERARRPAPAHAPAAHQTEIARRRPPAASTPCLAAAVRVPSPERRPRTAARARSLPADLDVCAEPRRLALAQHCARFQQAFQVCDSLTVSVADLTALDYRGGPRRPRHPPPPPPRNPPPPPPAPPRAQPPMFAPPPPLPTAREPSADSDSTTESERAFAREMETTARRLDEDARRALADGGDFRRELSVLTARRLHDASWGVWDDVLDELRKRMAPPSPTPSPERTPSPNPVREPIFSSTPLRPGDARVRSTPELRARASSQRSTPEELRASLQHVAGPLPGEAPPVRSVSTGSKGVTFSPVVAEVSWRETSPSTNAESESARSSSTSDDAADAEVIEVGGDENEPTRARPTERAVVMQDAGARAPRSRIAGFLSRFANFRFSGRKEKKSRGASANGRVTSGSGGGGSGVPLATDGSQSPITTDGPQYVRIPLKDEGVSRAETSPTAGGGAGPVAHKPPRPARPPPVPQPTVARPPAPRPSPAPAAGLLETDVDTARTVLHARSLLALAPPDQAAPRPHKSMEFLLDKDSAQAVQPPENELQKNSDRVLSEHELRVQRSLQKLNVPEWYKNAPAAREGFLLRKRLSDASAASAARWASLNAKTTSLGSLGGQPPPPQLSPHTTSFGRWSTSRLNSNQTSPCSSTRSSVRGGSPLCSPSTRSSFSARQPYLGWRSQERLCSTPRTPHERLASSLLQSSRDGSASRASEEIQTSIKEVTSAIVHYVSGLEPANGDLDRPSPRSSQKLYWLESSFVGTKPLESPQTPLVVSEALPPPHPRPPSSLRLEHRAAPDWQETQRSVTLNATRPSPGSTTLEDVLDSLLGLPSQPARLPTPQPSPRKPSSPYYLLSGKSPRYEQLSGHSSWSGGGSPDVSPQPGPAAALTPPTPTPPPPSADQATVDSAGKMQGSSSGLSERGRRQSEPCTSGSSITPLRRISLDNGAPRPPTSAIPAVVSDAGSAGSLHTENSGEDAFVRCKHPKCGNRATPADARRHYKSCHNCTTFYCSRECRRAHWEKHRKLCLHTRVSSLCRRIIATAKEDEAALQRVSVIAHEGYLAHGRGLVKLFFTSSEAAEKFVAHGYQLLTEPEYLKWTELRPDETGAELYTEVVRLCKTYNPETRLILYACVCVVSEVPTKGAVKWERRLVSRCAKLRLARAVSAVIGEANRRRERRRSRDPLSPQDVGAARETLILISKSCPTDKNAATAHKFREICFRNIQSELELRGVNLKKHYPEVYSRLTAYVEGASDKFVPVTIYPKDVASGRPFVCVIMPDTEVEADALHPPNVTTINVGFDRANHQLSTPM